MSKSMDLVTYTSMSKTTDLVTYISTSKTMDTTQHKWNVGISK